MWYSMGGGVLVVAVVVTAFIWVAVALVVETI